MDLHLKRVCRQTPCLNICRVGSGGTAPRRHPRTTPLWESFRSTRSHPTMPSDPTAVGRVDAEVITLPATQPEHQRPALALRCAEGFGWQVMQGEVTATSRDTPAIAECLRFRHTCVICASVCRSSAACVSLRVRPHYVASLNGSGKVLSSDCKILPRRRRRPAQRRRCLPAEKPQQTKQRSARRERRPVRVGLDLQRLGIAAEGPAVREAARRLGLASWRRVVWQRASPLTTAALTCDSWMARSFQQGHGGHGVGCE